MKPAELILTVANAYTMDTRATEWDPFDNLEVCVYWNKEKNCGCAVGMWLKPERREEFTSPDWYGVGVDSLVHDHDTPLESILVENVHNMSLILWKDLQQFHDKEDYWDDTGLSLAGWDFLNYLLSFHVAEFGR